MQDYGKNKFDGISIPAELAGRVNAAVRKGHRHRIVKNIASCALSFVLLLGISANIPVLYTYASQIPILGNVVKIMHTGSGGNADGQVYGQLFGDGRKVYFQFKNSQGEDTGIPPYSVRQLKYPYGLVLHLHDVKKIDQRMLWEELERIPGVRKAYPLSLSEPQDVGVTVLLENRSSCVVSELEDSVLEISFLPREPIKEQSGYLLCSEAMEAGATLAELQETLAWEGAFQLPEKGGKVRIALGPYTTVKQAMQAQQGIQEVRGVSLRVVPIASGEEG